MSFSGVSPPPLPTKLLKSLLGFQDLEDVNIDFSWKPTVDILGCDGPTIVKTCVMTFLSRRPWGDDYLVRH